MRRRTRGRPSRSALSSLAPPPCPRRDVRPLCYGIADRAQVAAGGCQGGTLRAASAAARAGARPDGEEVGGASSAHDAYILGANLHSSSRRNPKRSTARARRSSTSLYSRWRACKRPHTQCSLWTATYVPLELLWPIDTTPMCISDSAFASRNTFT